MGLCRPTQNSRVCNHLGSLQRMEKLQNPVCRFSDNFHSKTLHLCCLMSLCSLFPQANEVLQNFLQSQGGVEEAILQADPLTDGDKAIAIQGSERLLLKDKTPGFLASRGDRFNLGPETRLDRWQLLCSKVLLKYKGDRESFWHRHQKGAKEYPPSSL